MPITRWTLTDHRILAEDGEPVAETLLADEHGVPTLTGEELPDAVDPPEIVVRQLVCSGGLSDNVELIQIDSGEVTVFVCPTRGMGLWKMFRGEHEFGWNSPVDGPVHPAFVPLVGGDGLGWLEGFDELLTRCGLESNGPPVFSEDGKLTHPLHGRIANRPAQFVTLEWDSDRQTLRLTGVMDETRFLVRKLRLTSTIELTLGEPTVRITDRVENLAAREATMQLLYHVNLGPPVLGEGAEVVLPTRQVTPRDPRAAERGNLWHVYEGPTPGYEERVYFIENHADADGRSGAMLQSPDKSVGFGMTYDMTTLPYFVLWKNEAAEEDGYVTGIEPGTNFTNAYPFEVEQGRVVRLAPGESRTFRLELTPLVESDEVTDFRQRIEALRPAKD